MALPVHEIIEEVIAELDHAPKGSPEWERRVIRAIQKGQETLAEDAPFMFNEREVHFRIEPDARPTAPTTDLLETTADPFVLKRVLADAHADIAAWETNREWTGRTLLVHDPADAVAGSPKQFHDFQIREVWSAGGYTYVSLTAPWGNAASAVLEWVIQTKAVVLPPEVLEIDHIYVKDQQYAPLEGVLPEQAVAWLRSREGDGSRAEGVPTSFWRTNMAPIEGPHLPTVAAASETNWVGPEPVGDFQYFHSLVWGKQEIWLNHGNPHTQSATAASSTRYKPWQESALSRGSAAVAVTAALGKGVDVTTPNMDFAAGFHDAAVLRHQKSGWKKRIYRKRLTDAAGNALTDFDQRAYLMTEIDGHVTTWTDDGSITPDRNTPAPYPGAYHAIDFWPVPDRRYEVVLVAAWYNSRIETMTQVLNVTKIGARCIIDLVKAQLHRANGNYAGEGLAMKDYRMRLVRLKHRQGTGIPASQPIHVGLPGRRRSHVDRSALRNQRPGDTDQTTYP
jgi:hypothetical protein